MNQALILAILPLALASVLYLLQAGGYQFIQHRPGMALAFIGYVIANVGLIWDAISYVK